jgi:membrane protease YdiL (CAAX protease family)
VPEEVAFSHIGHPPSPNWRYALLACLAGVAYGYVYQRTRSIAASALTHALVDWTWIAAFAGR